MTTNHNNIYSILGKLNALQPVEVKKDSILKDLNESAPTASRSLVDRLNERFLAEKANSNEATYYHPGRGLRDGGTDRLAGRQAAASAGNLGQDELKQRMQGKASQSLRVTAPGMGKPGSKLPGAKNPAYRGPANPYAEGTELDEASKRGGKRRLQDALDDDPDMMGYHAIAALYGNDMWDNDAMGDLVNDLEQVNPTPEELEYIILNAELPGRLKSTRFTNTDDVQFGHLGEVDMDEDMLSPKQQKIAKMSPPADKIDANDLAALRAGKTKEKEGNEFSGELAKAKAQHKDEFEVDGKTYPVKESEGKRTMSRAAKGYEKYGKEGMEALAKAGREGKDLDKVRDKYNKYKDDVNEGETQGATKYTVTYKDSKKPGKTHSTQVKATSSAEAKAAFQEWDSTNRFTYLGAKPNVNKVNETNFGQQDSGEYDREGEMADQDLETAQDAAQELRSILDADENLPEWVQAKITKAVDYLDTARDYMQSKGDEVHEGEYQDKVDKSKIPAFQRKSKGGDDWKLSTKDLDDEASKSPTSSAGLEKLKQRMRDQGVMESQLDELDMNLLKGMQGAMKGVNTDPESERNSGKKYGYRSDRDDTGNDDDYDEYGNEKKGVKKTATSDGPKKKGRPKKNFGPERVTAKAYKHKGARVGESIKLDTFVEDTMAELDTLLLSEKAVSKQQQKFMGMVHAMHKGKKVKGASSELKKAASGMSKKDAKDFASTKHKGLPKKVSEGTNFAEMVRETDQTVEEMLTELHSELDEYKRTGHMGDKLRDALEIHRHTKRKLMGEENKQRDDFFHNPSVPDDHQLPAPPEQVDVELDELARLAGLSSPVQESACNMTAEGEMCPKHGMAECWSSGGMMESKPDFLDMDKDGDKKEPMKKAVKDKKELDEIRRIAGLLVVEAEDDEDDGYANEPNEQYVDQETINDQGADLNRKKHQDPYTANKAANPVTEEVFALEGKLAAMYNSIKVQK
jgi:hypothetical protein